MSANYYWLPKFDPDADYIVAAWPVGFTVSGFQPKPGQAFDKQSVNKRMLEELYTKRWIKLAVIVPTAVAQVLSERETYATGGTFSTGDQAGRPIQELLTPTDYPTRVEKPKRTRNRKHAAA